jgi:hypothetical protein
VSALQAFRTLPKRRTYERSQGRLTPLPPARRRISRRP